MIKSDKLVHGIGSKGMEYPTWDGKKILKEYDLWSGMLSRCERNYWVKQPSYINTNCSENFKSYTFFYEWCQTQIGFGNIDEKGRYWQIDKDLLYRGNKFYSEDTCVFLPHNINCLFTKSNRTRGRYPIGVHWNNRVKVFKTQCSKGEGKQDYLGQFICPQEAFFAYKAAKEMYIKQVAKGYKDQLDPRAYEALMNYEVNIDD